MHRQTSAVLDDIASELAELARVAGALQDRLEDKAPGLAKASLRKRGASSDLAWAANNSEESRSDRADLVIALQSLDYITQTLQCLSAFVAGASREVPEGVADLTLPLRAVWMSRLKERFGCNPTISDQSDDIEMFDAA